MKPQLLSRDEFRESVFKRDNNMCIICAKPAQDAHHIMERRLFADSGYYLDNGVTLCGKFHIKAEQTLLSPETLRSLACIHKRILPEHLYEDYEYTKWGDIENANGTRIKGEVFFDESVQKILSQAGVLSLYGPYVKYPRTYHLPFSMGRTDDDKVLKDCSQFEGQQVVITVKMDGENTTGYFDGYIHARSLDSNNHESRNWVKNYLSGVLYDLPENWRICGENLYAKHSIHYHNLRSYFSLFSIWNETNTCLSWGDTIEWADLLGLNTVPVLYQGIWDEDLAKELYKEVYGNDEMEGFVVRLAGSFSYGNFRKSVGKFVRENHVTCSQHWIKHRVTPNQLIADVSV